MFLQSKIPLGLVIQAMALDIDQKDGGLEVVNFGAQVRREIYAALKPSTGLSCRSEWVGRGGLTAGPGGS